jgi:RNA polymerase sigma-70 factor (ECF subfamily)
MTDRLPPELELLLERHLPALRAFVRLRAGRTVAARESSSDLVQSVCRELLQGAGRFEYDGEAAFKSWLFTAALRKIVEKDRYYRAEKRDAAREAGTGGDAEDASLLDGYATLITPSRDVAVREQLARVERAFEQLSDEQREVVTLARIVGLPHAEIARQLGRSEEATRQLLRRAMVRLSGLLTES